MNYLGIRLSTEIVWQNFLGVTKQTVNCFGFRVSKEMV
jgi:hypothetical protein